MIPRELFGWLAGVVVVAAAAHTVGFTQYRQLTAAVERDRAARDLANATPDRPQPKDDVEPVRPPVNDPPPISNPQPISNPPDTPGTGGGPKLPIKEKPEPKPDPPSKPEKLTATALDRTSIKLTWAPLDPKTTNTIEVLRQDGNTFVAAAKLKNTATEWTDGNRMPGTEYQYKLVAVGQGNLKVETGVVAAKTVPKPDAPGDFKAIADGTSGAKLTWGLPKNAEATDFVRIERTINQTTVEFAARPGDTAYSDTSAQPGRTYSYRLQLVGKDQVKSEWTSGVELTIPVPKPIAKKLTGEVLVVVLHTRNLSDNEAQFKLLSGQVQKIASSNAGRLVGGKAHGLDADGLKPWDGKPSAKPFETNPKGVEAALNKLFDEVNALQDKVESAQFAVCILWHTPRAPTLAAFGDVKLDATKKGDRRFSMIWGGDDLRGQAGAPTQWFPRRDNMDQAIGPVESDDGFVESFKYLYPNK